jgi:ribosomal protein S27AE
MMKSRLGRFEAWLKNKKCPRCGETKLIPKNPRYDKKFLCCHCGMMGKIVRKANESIS